MLCGAAQPACLPVTAYKNRVLYITKRVGKKWACPCKSRPFPCSLPWFCFFFDFTISTHKQQQQQTPACLIPLLISNSCSPSAGDEAAQMQSSGVHGISGSVQLSAEQNSNLQEKWKKKKIKKKNNLRGVLHWLCLVGTSTF